MAGGVALEAVQGCSRPPESCLWMLCTAAIMTLQEQLQERAIDKVGELGHSGLRMLYSQLIQIVTQFLAQTLRLALRVGWPARG